MQNGCGILTHRAVLVVGLLRPCVLRSGEDQGLTSSHASLSVADDSYLQVIQKPDADEVSAACVHDIYERPVRTIKHPRWQPRDDGARIDQSVFMQCEMLGASATGSRHCSTHGSPVVEPKVTRAYHRPCLWCAHVSMTRMWSAGSLAGLRSLHRHLYTTAAPLHYMQ